MILKSHEHKLKESGTHEGTLIRNPTLNFTKVWLGTTNLYKLMAICYLNNLVTNATGYRSYIAGLQRVL